MCRPMSVRRRGVHKRKERNLTALAVVVALSFSR